MRLNRFIFVILFIDIAALFHIWQQTQITHLSYQIENKLDKRLEFLDQNHLLRYNVAVLKSCENVQKNLLAGRGEFQLPSPRSVVKLSMVKSLEAKAILEREKRGFLKRLFSLSSFAWAKPR